MSRVNNPMSMRHKRSARARSTRRTWKLIGNLKSLILLRARHEKIEWDPRRRRKIIFQLSSLTLFSVALGWLLMLLLPLLLKKIKTFFPLIHSSFFFHLFKREIFLSYLCLCVAVRNNKKRRETERSLWIYTHIRLGVCCFFAVA